MRRKLIKQGINGFTVYLPKKWIDSYALKQGNEVDMTLFQGNILISPLTASLKKKSISFPIKKGRESAVRTLLVNAYRAGFDTIKITYDGKEKELQYIVNNFMLGFALFKKGDVYVLESISEPSAETFDNILHRQFYLIEELLKDITSPLLIDYVHTLQKHDNFLKRCIAKELFHEHTQFLLWQFLSYLVQIARLCYHLQQRTKGKLNGEALKLLPKIQCMFSLLHTAYMKKDFLILSQLHDLDEELQNKEQLATFDISLHYILMISRIIYLANSPLTGYLQLRGTQST
jgi:hypothetical protein